MAHLQGSQVSSLFCWACMDKSLSGWPSSCAGSGLPAGSLLRGASTRPASELTVLPGMHGRKLVRLAQQLHGVRAASRIAAAWRTFKARK